jgi:hypothetical protein
LIIAYLCLGMQLNDTSSFTVNPWDNAYWFARMLVSVDKYGAIGTDNKLLSEVCSALRVIAQQTNEEEATLSLQKQTLLNILQARYRKATTKQARVNLFCKDVCKMLGRPEDMEVFLLTCESVILPTNQALANIPNDDRVYSESIAKSYLDLKKEAGLATVIALWDDLGTKGCLTAERTEIIKAFAVLRSMVATLPLNHYERDSILTALVQEFERRAGQKRKSRAGGSLEDVTSFILQYYGIKSVNAPEHFQADIEVDNWIKTSAGWLLGVSCKRTLRERWKQVSSADAALLSRFKILQLFHVITFDEDLSDDKITLLGAQRHIFYLPDNSRTLKHAQAHIGLKEYVRPLSGLIKDIKSEISAK